MAISTGDIDATAIAALQTKIEAGLGDAEIELDLMQLCYIFKKKWELDSADIRTDFADMAAWLEAQTWSTGNTRFIAKHYYQKVVWTQEPEPA